MARSGDSSTMAPSRCERKVTPCSSSLRKSDSDITWKPPESVRIGSGQFMKACRPPSAAMRSAPGPQHQMIGIAEHDLGAGRRYRPPASSPFTVACVPTGMKAGVCTRAMRRDDFAAAAAPSVASRWKEKARSLVFFARLVSGRT